MQILHNVTFDASVFAIPENNSNKNVIYKYIETLMEWNKLLTMPWVNVSMSKYACESLYMGRVYPMFKAVKELISMHAIEECAANDLYRIINSFFDKQGSFENVYKVEEVLFDHKNLKSDPNVFGLASFNDTSSDLARCILLIAILRENCSQPLRNHTLILSEVSDTEVWVKSLIFEIDHCRDDIFGIPSPPKFFKGKVFVCDSFQGLIESLNESAILADASNNDEVELAIRIALFKSTKQSDTSDWSRIIVPIIGVNFWKSCQEVCKSQGESIPYKILQSVVEIATGRSKRHSWNTGRGGNDPQKIRRSDNAKGWRHNIDDEFRLHYWKCSGEKIELVSVNFHNDVPN